MADAFSVTMSGVDELSKKLQGLQYDMQKKGGRFALRKAAQVVRDQARANAQAINDPRTRNVVAKNITEKWSNKFNKASGDLMFRVGVLGGARDYSAYGEITTGKDASLNPGGDTFYWRFVEFGTEHSAARPFMRPAFDQSAQKATDTFIQYFWKAVDREIRKSGNY